MQIEEISLRRVSLPLTRPYRISYATFERFEPIVAEVRSSDGRVGWGEAEISPGYGQETPEGAWRFCLERAEGLIGLPTPAAKQHLVAGMKGSPGAASVLLTAIEMMEGHPTLATDREARVPLLEAVHQGSLDRIPQEIEELLARGFRTLKVKVGWDVDADLARVAAIQRAVDGRALIRLDANQGFTAEQGRRFAAALNPDGIELFEQPCRADDWDANAGVAKASNVPIMLDESIYRLADIDRAARLDGVGFVKLKVKKIGGLALLKSALERIRALGMTPVLGDGTATEITCRMEACLARLVIDNAGEMNGFLKVKERLFAEPLEFEAGAIVLPRGWRPTVDRQRLDVATLASERLTKPRIAGSVE